MAPSARVLQALAWLKQNRIRQTILGLFIGLPHVLFWLLASSNGFHWWRGPQPASLNSNLLVLLVVNASAVGLSYGAIRGFFWKWFERHKPAQPLKAARLRFSYTFLPLLYGSIAVWGYETSRKQYGKELAVAVVVLWVIYDLVLFVLSLAIRFRKPAQPAA